MIPLTAAETRRLFNLHTRVTRPEQYHERWSDGVAATRPAPGGSITSAGSKVSRCGCSTSRAVPRRPSTCAGSGTNEASALPIPGRRRSHLLLTVGWLT